VREEPTFRVEITLDLTLTQLLKLADIIETAASVEAITPVLEIRKRLREALSRINTREFVPGMPPRACKHLMLWCSRHDSEPECPCTSYEPREAAKEG